MLLRRAHDAGLRVKPVGGQLLVHGPRRAEPLVRLLAAHKAEVMAALTQRRDTGEISLMSEPLIASLTAAIRGLMPSVSRLAK
jgi:hypothetical protein